MITEDYGIQSTKITKDYRPSVRDYSHVADPLEVSLIKFFQVGASENGGEVCGVETEAILITLLGSSLSRVDLWPINSDRRLFIQ